MVAAAVSLAFYIPYKYATQLHAIDGMYAVMFPLSSILAIAGIVLGLRPGLTLHLSLPVRVGAGVIAAGWLATGMLCVPSLTEMTLETPAAGLFAFFHMLVQHVVLSFGVAALVLAPRATYTRFGVELPAPGGPQAADAWAATSA